MTEPATSYPCRVEGRACNALILADGLSLDGRVVSWIDADVVHERDHAVTLVLPSGEISVSHLGAGFDRFCRELREARGLVRRAALTQATGAPIDSFLARDGDQLIDVHLSAGALAVEPRGALPCAVPLSSITEVTRDGWTITVEQRVFEPVVLRGLGKRTDEFLADVRRARDDLSAATRATAGLPVDDGWAVEPFGELRARIVGGARAEEVAFLASVAGDRLRAGVWTDGGRAATPFVLAPVGSRVAVEATDSDDRATYIFETDDVERLNAVLVLTTFRREVYALPDAELGRWAAAVRVLAPVRWLRDALVARVVHDETWADKIRTALRV